MGESPDCGRMDGIYHICTKTGHAPGMEQGQGSVHELRIGKVNVIFKWSTDNFIKNLPMQVYNSFELAQVIMSRGLSLSHLAILGCCSTLW